jgi:hypothetical protein
MRLRHLTAALAAALTFGLGSLALAAVPNPTVSGPIPARAAPGDKSHDYPWMTTMHNLAAAGYVEEEFFYEGSARRFDTAGPNAMAGKLIDGDHRYRTRMIVRRPKDMSKFNGTVLAEWENVTAGYDLDAMWGGSYEHIVRAGYVWIGLSPQRVGVQQPPNGLKIWSPARYGSLDVTDGGKVTDDSLSYDIFAQGLQAIRNPQGVNVLGGAEAKIIIAMGASQSAGRLGTYINSLNATLGDPIDAYLMMIGGARVREGLNKPVFKLLSETDIPGQVAARQTDTARFRHWEVVGVSHSTRRTAMNSGSLTKRDGVSRAAANCTYPTYPRVPMNYVLSAIYDHMVRWVRDGTAPPTAPKAEVDGNVIRRDARGNALGGIRLAEFDPATAIDSGVNGGDGFCRLYGRYSPFTDAELKALYPTHAAYVSAASARTDANLKAGYILADDARQSKARAEQSIYGLGAPCAAACHAAQDLVDSSYYFLGLSNERDRLIARAAGVVRTIAEGDRAGGAAKTKADAKARADLDRWVADLRALQKRGALSEVTVSELAAAADTVKAAL